MDMSDSDGIGGRRRWVLVAVAALAMGLIGTYQFVWSSIRLPLGARLGASETALGTVFTVFLVFQAVSQFPAGWVRDRWGPKVPLLVGAPLVAIGYAWTGVAGSLPAVYAAYAIGGIGSGVVYTVAVNTPVKWFTERRGLATGAVTTAYSGISFLLIPGVRRGVDGAFESTLLALGVATGAVALLGAAVLRDPPRLGDTDGDSAHPDDGDDPVESDGGDSAASADGDLDSGGDGPAYGWRETVRTWQFWVLYAVFVVINGVGLMLIGKVISYANALALPAAAATASASVVAVADALGIAIIGGVSDRLGRERTVAASLVLGGVALAATVPVGTANAATGFVALVGLAALFRSPPFSIFPSLVGEYYGQAYSSENYALLYSAKIWGSIFGGTVASGLVVTLGWTDSFLLAAAALALAGLATATLSDPNA
ncbi:MFS transporter [Halosimplex aquaticum]|uniref:MFS transporter n=1 Tax=Halosimplex aquaticum TaxID=3026162 RepID=A0ABD5XVK5_9EURY|nr:MFS transporter [Halosimplex aquaticum]